MQGFGQRQANQIGKLHIFSCMSLHIKSSLYKLNFVMCNKLAQFQKILVRYGLFMVGSTMSGLGTENSDIDMCLLVKPCLHDARSDALSYLQNIQNVLQNCGLLQRFRCSAVRFIRLIFRFCNST